MLPSPTLAVEEYANKDVKTTERPLSQETSACLACHEMFTPGIVEDWLESRHSQMPPQRPLSHSSKRESHSINWIIYCWGRLLAAPNAMAESDAHKDDFEHFGFRINVSLFARDCSTCRPVEEEQFRGSKKANAYGNLRKIPYTIDLFRDNRRQECISFKNNCKEALRSYSAGYMFCMPRDAD